jgi:hypothetical protein
VVTIIEKNSKFPIPIPVPNIDILKPRLSLQSPPILKVTQITPSASDDAMQAALGAVGKMFDTADVLQSIRSQFQGPYDQNQQSCAFASSLVRKTHSLSTEPSHCRSAGMN